MYPSTCSNICKDTARSSSRSLRLSNSVYSGTISESDCRFTQDTYSVGNFPSNAISGYTGYVPGIRPESCYGGSREKLLRFPCGQQDVNRSRRSRLTDMVGYTGYIPGKNSGNVFGQSFSQASRTAKLLKNKEKSLLSPTRLEYISRARKLLDNIKPSNVDGNYSMYLAKEKAMVLTNKGT